MIIPKPKSTREKMLLVFLVCSVTIACYIIFRVQDRQLEMLVAKERLQSTKSDLSGLKVSTLTKVNVSALKEEIDALKEVISGDQITLTSFEETFIDLTQNDAIAKVRAEITRLCDGNKLQILSINRSEIELSTLAGVATTESKKILARPQFSITLRGEFSQIKSLLYQLKKLPYMVVVTQLNIKSDNKDLRSLQPELTSTLTFAF